MKQQALLEAQLATETTKGKKGSGAVQQNLESLQGVRSPTCCTPRRRTVFDGVQASVLWSVLLI